jgi:hypothetical protein
MRLAVGSRLNAFHIVYSVSPNLTQQKSVYNEKLTCQREKVTGVTRPSNWMAIATLSGALRSAGCGKWTSPTKATRLAGWNKTRTRDRCGRSWRGQARSSTTPSPTSRTLGSSAKTLSANLLEANRHCLMKLPRLGRILRHESLDFPFSRRLAHQINLCSFLQ